MAAKAFIPTTPPGGGDTTWSRLGLAGGGGWAYLSFGQCAFAHLLF